MEIVWIKCSCCRCWDRIEDSVWKNPVAELVSSSSCGVKQSTFIPFAFFSFSLVEYVVYDKGEPDYYGLDVDVDTLMTCIWELKKVSLMFSSRPDSFHFQRNPSRINRFYCILFESLRLMIITEEMERLIFYDVIKDNVKRKQFGLIKIWNCNTRKNWMLEELIMVQLFN